MKLPAFRLLFAAITLAVAFLTAPVLASPKQVVIVIAEGVTPQILDLGRDYLRVADDAPELTTAFDALNAPLPHPGLQPLAALPDLLANAAKNGFKTGLVTTGDITTEAPRFQRFAADFQGGAAGLLNGANPNFDFIAGGGRAHFGAETSETLRARGDTYLDSVAGLDAEIRGRIVAPQAENDLDFALDRDPGQQAGLGELSALALDTLGKNDAPFVLVIHDTLIEKALDTRDTPALFGEFRELNALLTDIVARRAEQPGAEHIGAEHIGAEHIGAEHIGAEQPDLQLAVWLTGSQITPQFITPIRAEQQSALRALSNFSLSYAGAGRALEGADDAALDDFTNALDGQYPGVNIAASVRQQFLAGTLTADDAVRAASEPLLKIVYNGAAAGPVGFVLGMAHGDLEESLQSAVAAPIK